MKYSISLALFFVLFSFASIAQTGSKSSGKKEKKVEKTSIITGTITDNRKMPIKNVKAYVYKADGSIAASGYTDATGKYETNRLPDGDYSVHFVYPNAKYLTVSGIKMKTTLITLNLKADQPESDTTATYDALMPKVEPPKGVKK